MSACASVFEESVHVRLGSLLVLFFLYFFRKVAQGRIIVTGGNPQPLITSLLNIP